MHHLPKPILLSLFLLFFNISAFAQTTFDFEGRLSNIKITNNSIEPAATPLLDVGNQIKEEMRMLFLQKTEEAIRILRSNNYKKLLHKLYLQIWNGDSASLLTYLRNVETALQSGSLANFAGLGSTAFNAIFNKHLSDTAMVFRWLPLNNQEGVLVKKDVFNGFITDYYNETLPGISTNNIYINKEDIVEASYYLLEQPGKINALMNAYRGSLSKFRRTLYDSLRTYHVNLTAESSPFTEALNLLRNDWFKQWFWITGGEIRINPIDFGVDTITKKYISDISKINIASHGPDAFFLEKRLDSLDKYFMLSKPNIAAVEKWINKVSIPANTPFFQFSAISKIKFMNNEKELKRNLYVDETKTLVIHNISADRKARLREDRKAIPNISGFQQDLGEVISKLGELAKAYAQITGAPSPLILDFFAPRLNYNNSVITSRTSQQARSVAAGGRLFTLGGVEERITIKITCYDIATFSVVGRASENFLTKLRNVLQDSGLLITPIFTHVFRKDDITFKTASDRSYKDTIAGLLSRYLELITQDAATQILEDSFMVAGMLRIYNTASSPLLQTIKTNQDNHFRYYSDTLKTTPLDSTVENTVLPYTVVSKTNADSVFVGKFTYKIGRTKRFTLSAGLTYTLNSYDQSVAKAENGTISITNSNQLFRLMVGLNIYFDKGLYSLNNDLGKFYERWYGFVGVGIPKSVENLYIGVGRDLYPGLKLTAGVHIAKHNKYLIQNNQIVEERLRYRPAGPFVSVAIDPISLVNLLNVFKK